MARYCTYKTEYATDLLAAAAEGLSLTAFAGSIGVCRDTLHRWSKRSPEFALAKARAHALRTAVLEQRLLAERQSSTRVAVIRLALANSAPEEWSRRTDQTLLRTEATRATTAC